MTEPTTPPPPPFFFFCSPRLKILRKIRLLRIYFKFIFICLEEKNLDFWSGLLLFLFGMGRGGEGGREKGKGEREGRGRAKGKGKREKGGNRKFMSGKSKDNE